MIAPDVVVLNGRIATMDAAGTEVEALAVHGGRIVARGSTAAMRDLAGPGTRVIDLERRRAIPCIVDGHAHPDAYAIRLARGRAGQRRPCRIAPRPLAEAEASIERYGRVWEANARRLDGLPAEIQAGQGGSP
ncbi:hypothetical protein [Elioraea sp.]|uniref:hypothetical protein n=1 Tax=Elioraea sp. TaxID=2185103 RepID=UPI003F72E027